MAVEVKFCGLTRSADAVEAARLGASYVGVVFAGGPRLVSPSSASTIFAGVPRGVHRIGVFGPTSAQAIGELANDARLDGVQLHGDPKPADVERMRRYFGGTVWAVVRVTSNLPPLFDALAASADAIVLDARISGALGGTGARFDWGGIARPLEKRRPARLVVAGGLTPENVADAVAILAPDIVDVSSGVESAPGEKDHARMRAFVGALAAPGAS